MVASGIWKSQGNRFSPETLKEISDTLTLASEAGLRLLALRAARGCMGAVLGPWFEAICYYSRVELLAA